MRLGEAGRRTRWVVVGSEGGPASGSGRVQAARTVRRVVVRARVRGGGGGDNAPGVAAGACRRAVRRPAAGGRAGGSRGHQYRFCFSYDNYLCSLMISQLMYFLCTVTCRLIVVFRYISFYANCLVVNLSIHFCSEFQAFLLIFFSELGDRTFFIAVSTSVRSPNTVILFCRIRCTYYYEQFD